MYSLRKVSKFNLFNVLQLYKEKQLLIYPKEQLSQVWAGWLVSLSWKHKKKYWIILMNFKATDKTKDEVLFFPNLYPPFTLLPREFSYLPLKVYWSCNYPLGNLTVLCLHCFWVCRGGEARRAVENIWDSQVLGYFRTFSCIP